jgi:putative oxidoreductase
MIDNQTQRVFFNNANGGWEYPAFWIIALLVQALLGDGVYALRPTKAKALRSAA